MNKNKKIESTHQNYIIRVEGKNAFHRGDTFASFEEVADRLQAHTQESLVYYWIRDSRLVKFAHTKVSRKIDEKLQYYSVKFSCIFGGQRFKSKSNGLRPCKRQTRQIDCPAFISMRATKCGRKLEVIDVCNDHTHEISEQAVEELPQKRRPSQGLLEEIQELLLLNVDKKMIIEYVKQKENKNILKKDLFNITTHLRLGMPRTRTVDEQRVILHRITSSATEDTIQHAVLRKLLQFESDNPLSRTAYQDSLKPSQNTLDVFDASTPSAIDFNTLSPEIDLLNTTDEVKDHMEYDELLSNRIIVDYEEVKLEENKPKTEANSSPIDENKWNEVSTRPTAIYNDFICGEDTSYAYGELELRKEISKEDDVQGPNHNSLVSDHSHDLNDKEYFNDLILISPDEAIYPADEPLSRTENSNREECITEVDHIYEENGGPTESVDTSIRSSKADFIKSTKPVERKDLPAYFTKKTRRIIMKCRSCGTNAKLIKMQISYLRQRRLKLFQENEILRLKKKKLKAEIEAIERSSLL